MQQERRILSPDRQLALMLQLCTIGHGDQYDKGGNPYSLHPIKVAHYLRTNDFELMCIALGHDLIEDKCKYNGELITFQMLRDLGFSDRVVEGIRCLTKLPGETLREYIDKVKTNIDAVLVKLCDLRHNSDIRRLKGVTEKDINRMIKYHGLHMELDEFRRNYQGAPA
jgi:(p)ppGpp synthase/HD superfamily hydrolase